MIMAPDITLSRLTSNIIKWSAGGTHGMKMRTNNHTHFCRCPRNGEAAGARVKLLPLCLHGNVQHASDGTCRIVCCGLGYYIVTRCCEGLQAFTLDCNRQQQVFCGRGLSQVCKEEPTTQEEILSVRLESLVVTRRPTLSRVLTVQINNSAPQTRS